MQITFDTENFENKYRGAQSLTFVIHYLKKHGCLAEAHYPSIEKITCRTPSLALKYCRHFASKGISPEAEQVFLKNPSLGVRYLRMVNKSEFSDPAVQKKFRRKFKFNPAAACDWAVAFGTRLTEEEEEVFRKDVSVALRYAKEVIRGKFPDRIHKMLVLASFDNLSSWQKSCLSQYVKFSEGK